MKISVKFIPITVEILIKVKEELKTVDEELLAHFNSCFFEPYEQIKYEVLDNLFLIAELTLEGNAKIKEITTYGSYDQVGWQMLYNEPDIAIQPVEFPLKVLLPTLPLEVNGKETFILVLESNNVLWDIAMDLPDHVTNERKFEIMLSANITLEDGTKFTDGEYAKQIVKF